MATTPSRTSVPASPDAARPSPSKTIPPSTAKSPGEIRARVLSEHADLRTLVREVDGLASAVAAGELRSVALLRQRAGALYRSFTVHMDAEDTHFAPLIYQIDAWGPVRFEQMRQDHENQLSALARAEQDLAIDGPTLGRAVQSTCWKLLHDMKREEHDLLHPDIWREDGVVVEFGG